MEAAGNHEVQNQEELVIEGEDDALADTAEGADWVAFDGGDGWDGRAEEERGGDTDLFEGLVEYAWGEGG